MNYFLDTNIIIILFQGRYEELRTLTLDILDNKNNISPFKVINNNGKKIKNDI